MALIARVSRLLRADLHAVLDRIEEPEVLLKQAVREMEEDIERDEQRLRLLTHDQAQVADQQSNVEERLRRIEQELDVCFAAANDDLARALVKRKLETECLHEALARKRDGLQAVVDELTNRLHTNRRRLSAMRQKADLVAADESDRRVQENWAPLDVTVGDDDIEVAFLREKQKRSRP